MVRPTTIRSTSREVEGGSRRRIASLRFAGPRPRRRVRSGAMPDVRAGGGPDAVGGPGTGERSRAGAGTSHQDRSGRPAAGAYEGFEGGSAAPSPARRAGGRPGRRPGRRAPNVVIVLCDDLGFADLVLRLARSPRRTSTRSPRRACSSPTSTSRRCARRRGPRCSPASTRTAPASGTSRNSDPGFPGYAASSADDVATMAEIFRDAGYATLAVGKWHLTKDADCPTPGRSDSWPLPARVRPLLRRSSTRSRTCTTRTASSRTTTRSRSTSTPTATTSPTTSPTGRSR